MVRALLGLTLLGLCAVAKSTNPCGSCSEDKTCMRLNGDSMMQKYEDGKWEDVGGLSSEGSIDDQVTGVVGRPLTPVSVGGVRRRTRRRTCAATSCLSLLAMDGNLNSEEEPKDDKAFCAFLEDEEDTGVFGRPLTPISVGGVRRRTRRRARRRTCFVTSCLHMVLEKDGQLSHMTVASKSQVFATKPGTTLMLKADRESQAHAASDDATVMMATGLVVAGILLVVFAVVAAKRKQVQDMGVAKSLASSSSPLASI